MSMESYNSFWEYAQSVDVWGNSLATYIVAFVVLVFVLVLLKILQTVVLKKLAELAARSKTDIDDTFITIFSTLKPPFYYFLAFYIAVLLLSVGDTIKTVLDGVLVVWVVYYVIVSLQIVIDYVIGKYIGEGADEGARIAYSNVGKLLKIALWVFGVILVLSNLGIEVSALIAGLGIGGIAVAFAFQKILGDLFSSFALHFDQPFTEGDYIVVGDESGVVKKIGIKTTRLQALQGEEIVISNQELTSARVQNFKKLRERRVVMSFGVTYDTPNDKMKDIVLVVRNILSSIDGVRFDRAHFKTFGDSALMFEVVYYVKSSDYSVHMDVQQEFNLRLKEIFEEKGISMAYPTQTLLVSKV